MRKSLCFFAAFIVSSLFILPLYAQEDFKPSDFSCALVYSGKEGGLLALEIPQIAYQGFRRPDMGDIRIFDASENLVPFTIRERPKELFTPPPQDVPFFMWDNENTMPANTDIEINTSGAVVRIKNQNSVQQSSTVFLVDLSFLNYPPSSLKITVQNNGANFNTPVSVHYSRDLSTWTLMGRRQVLASFGGTGGLATNGLITVQDTLDLSEALNRSTRYLLLSFERLNFPPVSMTAFFKSREGDGEYHEVIIRGQKTSDGKKIAYNSGAYYPAESIDFILSEADSIPVLIKNRMNEHEEWVTRAQGAIFRYNSAAGGIVKNDPFKIDSSGIAARSPFWELETSGGIPFSAAPEMALRFKVRELIFPARGEGPWTLAIGNADCPPLASWDYLPLGRGEELNPAFFTGEMRFDSEKAEALPILKERDYGTIFLWVFLCAAVLILSILSYTIAKSMKTNKQ